MMNENTKSMVLVAANLMSEAFIAKLRKNEEMNFIMRESKLEDVIRRAYVAGVVDSLLQMAKK